MALAACGNRVTPPTRDWNVPAATLGTKPPFASPGERIRYRISALGLELAALQMGVGELTPLEDKRAVVVQAVAESVGLAARVKPVRVEFTSWIDSTSGLPLLFRAVELDEVIEARFTKLANKKFPISTKVGDAPEKIEMQTTNGQPLELLGVLLVLRSWDDKLGASRTFDAVRSSYVWRTQVTVVGRESIATELGELPTAKFAAVSRRLMRDGSVDQGTEPRKFSVWISDDADRVPLRMVAETDYGDIKIEIVDFVAGRLLANP
ncbi:MAG: DUF3108 domain-containing protein [Kofleriaceae bacterium]